jgi:predicted MFS family arabinose efflux permease
VQRPLVALALNAAAVGLVAAGFKLDRGLATRLFPRGAFSLSVPFGLGFWVIVLMAIPESSVSAFLPFSVQKVWGYSPAIAGAVHSVLAFSWSLSQIFISTFVSEKVRRELIWVGPVLLACGLFVASTGVAQLSMPLVIVAQILTGSAFGINWGSISQMLMDAAPEDERVIASSLLPTAQTGGFALGAALSGLTGNFLGFADAQGAPDLQSVTSQVFLIAALAVLPVIPLAYKVVRGARR